MATLPAAAARDALFGCCPDDVAAWAIAQQRPQALAPFATPVSIPPVRLAGIPRYYVLCLRDRAIPPALQRRMSQEVGCAEVIEFDTDHTPHLSMPAQLADALGRFATHPARAAGGN